MSLSQKQLEDIHDLKGVLATLKSIEEEWARKHPDDRRFLAAHEACTERLAEIIKDFEKEN